MSNVLWIGLSIVFLVALFIVGVFAFLAYRSFAVEERNKLESDLNYRKEAVKTKIEETLDSQRTLTGAERRLKSAGLNKISATQFMFIRIGVLLLGVVIGALIGNLIAVLLGIIAGAVLPEVYLRHRISKRRLKFSEQLSACLPMIAENLRAGLVIESAIRNVINYMDDPLREEFRRVCFDLTYNIPLDEALESLYDRLGDKDIKRLAAIVSVQKEGGGNLSELLDIEAKHIKNRFKMRGHISAITSSGRMQGIVVGLIPALMLLLLSMMNEEMYAGFFFGEPLGWALLALVAVMEIMGIVIMRRIFNIKID